MEHREDVPLRKDDAAAISIQEAEAVEETVTKRLVSHRNQRHVAKQQRESRPTIPNAVATHTR